MADERSAPGPRKGRGCILGALGCLGLCGLLAAAVGVAWTLLREELVNGAVVSLQRDLQTQATHQVSAQSLRDLSEQLERAGERMTRGELGFRQLHALLLALDEAFRDRQIDPREVRELQDVLERIEPAPDRGEH